MEKEWGGYVLARFSGVVVAVTCRETEAIGAWLERSFEGDELSASLNRGDGILEVLMDGQKIRLDFLSPVVLKTVLALGKA